MAMTMTVNQTVSRRLSTLLARKVERSVVTLQGELVSILRLENEEALMPTAGWLQPSLCNNS